MKLQIKALSDKIGKEIPLPYYATDGAAALDLHACIDRALTVLPGERSWCLLESLRRSRMDMWVLWRSAAAWESVMGLA